MQARFTQCLRPEEKISEYVMSAALIVSTVRREHPPVLCRRYDMPVHDDLRHARALPRKKI